METSPVSPEPNSNMSIALPEASPARTSVRRAKESASSEHVPVCGKTSREWSERYDLPLSSLKTSPPFEVEGLPWSYKISGRSGMMRSGIVFPLAPLALITGATGSGSFPTLRACSGKQSSGANRSEMYESFRRMPTLTASTATFADMEQARYAGNDPRRPTYQEAKRLLPTMRATDADKDGRGDLLAVIHGRDARRPKQRKLLPTLLSTDWKSGQVSLETMDRNSRPLNEVLRMSPSSNSQSPEENVTLGPINPAWAEWYMGFPIGWTELHPSAE